MQQDKQSEQASGTVLAQVQKPLRERESGSGQLSVSRWLFMGRCAVLRCVVDDFGDLVRVS